MKILHISNEGLPDWRIEKSALTALKKGHIVSFAGKKSAINYNSNHTFSHLYELTWTAKARYGFVYHWHLVKKQFENILKEAKPDVIHAHNLFSAKMASEFDIPLVYDDHEFWSKLSKLLKEMSNSETVTKDTDEQISFRMWSKAISSCISSVLRRKILNSHIIRLWSKWEKELISSYPTITVSDKIAEELREIGNNSTKIFVVPNFPMLNEVKNFGKPQYHETLSSVYSGSDGQNLAKYPNHNIDGLDSLFDQKDIGNLTIIGWSKKSKSSKVKYTGFLERQAMYEEMFNHSIGLLPFKKHWSHFFVNPNKVYEYAHAGLFVVCTSSFSTVMETLKKNCLIFEDYRDLVSQLQYCKCNMDDVYKKRLEIVDFAHNHLIWENFADNILKAYQLS